MAQLLRNNSRQLSHSDQLVHYIPWSVPTVQICSAYRLLLGTDDISRLICAIIAAMLLTLTVIVVHNEERTLETLCDIPGLLFAIRETSLAVPLVPTSLSLANPNRCRWARSWGSASHRAAGRRGRLGQAEVLFNTVGVSDNESATVG
jgi:hypothetical protein